MYIKNLAEHPFLIFLLFYLIRGVIYFAFARYAQIPISCLLFLFPPGVLILLATLYRPEVIKDPISTYALTMAVMLLLTLKGSILKRIYGFALLFLFVNASGSFLEYILAIVLKLDDWVILAISDVLLVMTIGALLLFKRQFDVGHWFSGVYHRHQKLIGSLLMITGIIILAMTSLLHTMSEYAPTHRGQAITWIFSVMGCAGIILLMWTVLRVEDLNHRLEQLLQDENTLQMAQHAYYQAKYEKEESIRKYRHDMKHYLSVISYRLSDGKLNQSKEMVDELLKRFSDEAENAALRSGNEIIDALNLYYLQGLSEQNVKIMVSGKMPPEISIDDLHLSSLYGNLIENAVDELNRIPSNVDRYLKIIYEYGSRYLSITIENKNLTVNPALKSTKNHKAVHGIGLENVRTIIAVHDGEIDIENGDPFVVRVRLPYENISQ